MYAPAALFAVSDGEVATPLALVRTVEGPPNETLAPEEGAVNVTEAPGTGLPPMSLTVATSAAGNGRFTATVCGAPLVEVMLAGAPIAFVRLNEAGVATPAVEAVTL